jgi:hypothetical protein
MRPYDGERLLAPHRLKEGSIRGLGQAVYHAGGVGQAHFLRIVRWTLRLLRIGALQLVSDGAQIPEVAAREVLLSLIEVECRIKRCVRVALGLPFAEAAVHRAGIHDRGRIHGGDRSAKARVGPMAEGIGLILVDRKIFVELLELPQELDLPHGGAGVDREALPCGKGYHENVVDFRIDPLDPGVQNGR